jgi:hypothetical protein
MSRGREVRRRERAARRLGTTESGNRRWAVAGLTALAVVVAGVGAWFLQPRPSEGLTRERVYRGNACLLTGPAGINPPTTAAAWAGVRAGALGKGAQAAYLSVPDPQTQAKAVPVLGALVARQCSVVVAVDAAPVAAVRAKAAATPSVFFVVPAPAAPPGRTPNVVAIPTIETTALRNAVEGLVRDHVRVTLTGQSTP